MPASDRIKLRHLRSLVVISEQGSLVRAAEVLSVTQPAVSKTLAELEEIVGSRLFERTRKGVEPTPAGRVLVRYAGSSLRSLREGLDSISSGSTAVTPTIVVGALPNVAATVLPSALLRAETAANARLTVRTGSNAQLILALRQGLLDVVIGRLAEPADMQGLSFEQLYTEVLVFVVRPSHPLTRRRRLTVATLAQYPLILPDTGTRVREAADRFFLAAGGALPQHRIETIDVSFGRSYVRLTDAVWCSPLGAVETDIASGQLVRLPLDTKVTEGPVGLTWRSGTHQPPTLLLLFEAIRESASKRVGLH